MDTIKLHEEHIINSYARFPVVFTHGEGSTLYDDKGKSYVDFSAGLGVNSIGHGNAEWVKAIADQAAKLGHSSNLYYTEPSALLAKRLCELSGLSKVFFANSGAEANEGMIKVARKYSHDKYNSSRSTIVTLNKSFHGRTITTLAATGQDKFHEHFYPMTEGFVHIDKDDIAALESMGDDVCAVMLEIVQGEGGVYVCDGEFLAEVQSMCRQRDWLLLIDEVQTGIGRVGTFFGYQHFGLSPDVISFAKGIAGGLPLGGIITAKSCCDVITQGLHGTTFGANPVACAAALTVLDILAEVIPEVSAKGAYIIEKIRAMALPQVCELRGLGLMIGIGLKVGELPRKFAEELLENGLACLTAGSDSLRFLPPLTISYQDIDKGLEIFQRTLGREKP